MNRRPLRFVALAYAAVVLWVTVGPAPWRTSGNQVEGGILNPDAWTAPVTWTTGLPLGDGVQRRAVHPGRHARRAAHPPSPVAARTRRRASRSPPLIELVQVPEPDRISDPRDLVMNTGGRGARRASSCSSRAWCAAAAAVASRAAGRRAGCRAIAAGMPRVASRRSTSSTGSVGATRRPPQRPPRTAPPDPPRSRPAIQWAGDLARRARRSGARAVGAARTHRRRGRPAVGCVRRRRRHPHGPAPHHLRGHGPAPRVGDLARRDRARRRSRARSRTS